MWHDKIVSNVSNNENIEWKKISCNNGAHQYSHNDLETDNAHTQIQ